MGQRVRELRNRAGLSQKELGDRMGVTYQQIQKYENGSNRLSATLLFRLGQLFDVGIVHFFEGMPHRTQAETVAPDPQNRRAMLDFATSDEGAALIKAYLNVSDKRLRKRVMQLLQELGGE